MTSSVPVTPPLNQTLPSGNSVEPDAMVGLLPASPEALLQSSHIGTETLEDARPPVDLYGNEVTEAVARYRFDADGSLYELHSPQTELPRLGSPKS